MNVGIVTWYGVTNYGSALQAYALQRMVAHAGFECLILRHRVHEVDGENSQYVKSVRRFHPRQLLHLLPRRRANARGERLKRKAVANFREEYLNISQEYLEDCSVDLAVVGSDQIFDFFDYHGNETYFPFQFGHGVRAERVSAYAPSFGQATAQLIEESRYGGEIQQGVRNMAFLSARDTNTKEILESLSGRSVSRVLDPTLAYGFSDEKKTWIGAPPFGRYLVVYAWSLGSADRAFTEAVQRFARRHSLKTVSLGDSRPWCDLTIHDASPQEFFSVIAQATVVVTNMFHGTCFSILHSVPVIPIVEPRNANKLGDLLEQFGLTENQVDDVSSIAAASIPEIDYADVSARLESARSSSKQFLMKILGASSGGA